jgi:apolipoprotein N-acyltransferase
MMMNKKPFPESRPVGGAIVLLGALFTLAFAPFFLWPLALVALGGLYRLSTRAQHVKQAALAGFLFGLGHQLSSLYWIPRSFYIDAGEKIAPVFYAGIPALIGMASVLAGLTALVCACTRWAPPRLRPFVFVLAWLLFELIRLFPLIQFPWNPAGAVFAGSTVFIQGAAIGGVYGLSLLVVTGAVLFMGRWPAQGTGFALLLLLAGYGHWRLNQAPPLHNQPTLTSVRLVQGNVETAHKWKDSRRQEFLSRYLNLTTPSSADIRTILWPETAVAYAIAQDPNIRLHIAQALKPGQKLVTGFLRFEQEGDKNWRAYNSMGVLDETGTLSGVYDKQLLVPFGESLPLANLTKRFLRTLSFNRTVYAHGDGPVKLELESGLWALPLICYESIFSFHVQKNLNEQSLLLNITNDNWFDGTAGPYQHFALSRLRAVETGLPLIRVANTGLTAVVDPYGRLVARLPLRKTAALETPVPAPLARKPLYRSLWRLLDSYP